MPSPLLQNVTADVTKATEVIKSATALINGFQAALEAAIAKAIANGATEAELQPVSVLSDALETEADALAAAVVANTPAA
jgi:hypothetical protein